MANNQTRFAVVAQREGVQLTKTLIETIDEVWKDSLWECQKCKPADCDPMLALFSMPQPTIMKSRIVRQVYDTGYKLDVLTFVCGKCGHKMDFTFDNAYEMIEQGKSW